MSNININDLINPISNSAPLDVSKYNSSNGNFLISFLEKMELIRLVEKKIAIGKKDGLIGGPVHLGVGQEAVAVGVSSHLCNSDRVFSAHRSHGHLLALGADVRKLFAEILGKVTGHSRGMGGSMHLWDRSVGFSGAVPIVAGTVSLAAGAGLAAKMLKTNDIAVAYLGDGAIEEGVVHEALNLARIWDVPVLFVVENNLFASHMHISLRQPEQFVARFAQANSIPYSVIDGNNVLAVFEATAELVNIVRSSKGPAFLEAITYRWYGHVDWREDVDVGVFRSTKDLNAWRARDPIKRLRDGMVDAGIWSLEKQRDLLSQINLSVDIAWDQAMLDPYPNESQLLDSVYARYGNRTNAL